MNDELQNYARELKKVNFLVRDELPKSRFFNGLRMEVDEKRGRGWSEIVRIHNGLHVGLADYQLNQRIESCHDNIKNLFHLNILLSGHVEFCTSKKENQNLVTGDIWLAHGSFEKVLRTQFPDENICGLSIDLPREFIESWLGTSCCGASRHLEKLMLGNTKDRQVLRHIPLVRGLHHSSSLMRLARELVFARRQTFADCLRFESMALDFLSRILTIEEPGAGYARERTRKMKAVVDEAADILCQEWNEPPNISTLSRRVGVNESYLKEWFRRHTGMTIGEYIREQRMEKALEYIETGKYSILQTALFVGYSNPSHFSKAFKKFYGHLPSYYLPRAGKTF